MARRWRHGHIAAISTGGVVRFPSGDKLFNHGAASVCGEARMRISGQRNSCGRIAVAHRSGDIRRITTGKKQLREMNVGGRTGSQHTFLRPECSHPLLARQRLIGRSGIFHVARLRLAGAGIHFRIIVRIQAGERLGLPVIDSASCLSFGGQRAPSAGTGRATLSRDRPQVIQASGSATSLEPAVTARRQVCTGIGEHHRLRAARSVSCKTSRTYAG